MKKITIIGFLGALLLGILFTTNAVSNDGDVAEKVIATETVSDDMENGDGNYKIKSYHQKLQLECKHCHGDGPKEEYEELEDESCLSCHKTKDLLADRLQFMDEFETNPHNSVHDGKSLSCYECHMSHEPSVNMCADCHNITTWMKELE